jgi:two-component system sensor kinase FixL
MRACGTKVIAQNFGRQELLEREILEITDGERERLGRELHDGLCQSLAGIAALASALSKSLAANDEPGAAAAANEIARLLLDAIGEARDLGHSLGPIDLSGAGLHGLLETLARNVGRTYQISCSFASNRSCCELRRETEAHLLRIAQEAVHNAIAHGRADQIDISLESVDGSGLLSIRDNGVGLSEDYRDHNGIGLHTLGYRARAIGGSVTLARRPHGGTVVACAFRLPADSRIAKGAEHAPCPG